MSTTRRELLQWLGKGCVVALGADLLVACQGTSDAPLDGSPDSFSPSPPPPGDGSLAVDGAGQGAFPFAPGAAEQAIYERWPVRTVDQHEIEKILSRWQLTVGGMVENPKTYTFADLMQLGRKDMVVDLHCVEGWSVFDVPWNGLHLSQIFADVKPTAEATHVSFYTFDERYNESLPLAVALEPRTQLCYGVGGYTLPLDHGFPLRLVVPRLYGYKSAKYVTRIELAEKPIEGFWVKAGYDYFGEVPDVRLREGKY